MPDKEPPVGDETSINTRVEKVDFPRDPQERLGILLASVNVGPKAMTELLLPPSGQFIAPWPGLSDKFRRMVAGTDMVGVTNTTAVGYCTKSLCGIGLVAREYTIDYWGAKKLIGLGLSDAGEKYGVFAAALALATERKYEVSLYPIFGASNTSSKDALRAPLSRAMSMLFLANFTEPVTEKVICQSLNLPQSVVADALESLKPTGVIIYENISAVKDRMKIEYHKTSMAISEIKSINRAPTFTERVAQICAQLAAEREIISIDQVYSRFTEEERHKRKALRINISTTLSGLANQGYLERDKGFKGGGKSGGGVMSKAEISPLGRLIVEDFLIPLKNLAADDPEERERSKSVVNEVRANLAEYAAVSANLYYPFSTGYKRKQTEVNKSRIIQVLSGSESGLTRQDLAQILGVNENTASNYLHSLINEAILTRERRSAADYFRIASGKL